MTPVDILQPVGEPASPEGQLRLIEAQERSLVFDRFGYDDAWNVGVELMSIADTRSLPIAATIRFGDQVVFSAARAGATVDNDAWLQRKVNVVHRFRRASFALAVQMRAWGLDFENAHRLSRVDYSASGGGFPLSVRGSVVGVIAVSGLTDELDHDLVVDVLHRALHGTTDATRPEVPEPGA